MKLSGLIFAFGLILTLLARTKGKNWFINVTRNIHATLGSNVTIQFSFICPLDLNTGNVKIFWKKSVKTYVFHADDANVLDMYRGKTALIGKKEQRNCSLMIQNFREDNLQIYLRVKVNESEYSFIHDTVRITLSVANQQWTTIIICVAISVPVVLVAICLAGGICLRLKRKRTKVLNAEYSRHASFRRTLSNQATSENTSLKQASPEWTGERTTNNESIYENVNNPMLARCCS